MSGARLTFGWGKTREVLGEPNLMDLLRQHAEDALPEGIPFDPDIERAVWLADQGIYRVWTAYDGKTLAGYVGWYVNSHMHSRRTLTAITDAIYLAAPYRRGLAGVDLLRTCLPALKELGVRWVICDMRMEHGPIMQRLGFEQTTPGWRLLL